MIRTGIPNAIRMKQKETYLTEAEIRSKTVISVFWLLLFLAACLGGWQLLRQQPRDNRAFRPLRAVLNYNENLFYPLLGGSRLSKTYDANDVVPYVRVNGRIGFEKEIKEEAWRLEVIKINGDTLRLSLDDIKQLPKTEIIFDFKCIEGWDQVTHWGGVRFSDFIKAFGLEAEAGKRFTGLSTPNEEYYVGIDRKSMLHPQTLLCYEMNGKPLPVANGFPLRLIIPVKYGVKHLKCIGHIYFSNERLPDYWYERGYDYFCGL